jgi:taurine dioxygenase
MQLSAVSGALGAEVRGIDLESVDAADIATITELLDQHLVIFFPDQQLSIDGHHRLGRAFGELVANSYTPGADPAYPGVTVHRSEDGYVADVWHSDGQPRPAPIKLTILKMLTMPDRGGDTVWANQHLVYETLSAPLRAMLDELTALQRSLVNPSEESAHPAVVAHPRTGRKILYVSKAHTVRFLELTLGESRALIDYLVDRATQPEYTCRYHWAPGTVGMWDNLATVHYGVGDFTAARVFHRVMVAGEVLARRSSPWPLAGDHQPRTMVRQDGTSGVVGQMTERLWPSTNRRTA